MKESLNMVLYGIRPLCKQDMSATNVKLLVGSIPKAGRLFYDVRELFHDVAIDMAIENRGAFTRFLRPSVHDLVLVGSECGHIGVITFNAIPKVKYLIVQVTPDRHEFFESELTHCGSYCCRCLSSGYNYSDRTRLFHWEWLVPPKDKTVFFDDYIAARRSFVEHTFVDQL